MKKKYYDGEIPFDENGNQMHYPPGWKDVDWVANHVFSDTLELLTYGRGRSAAYFELKSLFTKKVYTVFMSDFMEIVRRMDKGVVEGLFTFCKKGSNYGLKLAE